MKIKFLLIFITIFILVLTSCGEVTESEKQTDVMQLSQSENDIYYNFDSIPEEFLTEKVPAYIEMVMKDVDISHASNFPRNDFTEKEREKIWKLYLEQSTSKERSNEESSYSIVAYFYPGSLNTFLSVDLYDDGSSEYEEVVQLYKRKRVLSRNSEDVENALQTVRDVWPEMWNDPNNLDTIHRLWYDEICSSPETFYEVYRNNFIEQTDCSVENYIILYVDIENVPDMIWEKEGIYTDYCIYLLRESIDSAWKWKNFGPATVKAGECWDGRHILIQG